MASVGHLQGYVWNKTGYSRGVKNTLAEVAALPSPKIGETVFCLENGKIHTFDGDLWMCDDYIKSINGTITTRVQGDAMVFQSTIGASQQVITTSTSPDARFAGIVVFAAAAGAPIALAYKGFYRAKITYLAEPTTPNYITKPVRASSLNAGLETVSYNVTGITSGHCGWIVESAGNNPTIPRLMWVILRGKTEYY